MIDALTEPLLMFPLTAEAAKAGRQEHFDFLFSHFSLKNDCFCSWETLEEDELAFANILAQQSCKSK